MAWLIFKAIACAALALGNPILAWKFWEEGKPWSAVVLALCAVGSAAAGVSYAIRIAGAA